MHNDGSVSGWIAGLKAGDQEAVQKLWSRYRDELIRMAKRRLDGMPRGPADEEDVLQSVLMSLCRAATAGRLDDVRNRDDLWWLLLAITRQKAVNLIRRETAQKRGSGRVVSALNWGSPNGLRDDLDHLVGDAPTPKTLRAMEEQNRRLLSLLRDDPLRKVAMSRVEGYTVDEIAATLDISKRSVERKLQLIRNRWKRELGRAVG